MKIRAFVSLCALLVVAVAATSISFSGTRTSRVDGETTAVCEHGGFQLTALLNSAAAEDSAESGWCGASLGESHSEAAAVQLPVINLHQAGDHMYISGRGFSATNNLHVDVHFVSGGALSPAYSLAIDSVGGGSFTSQPSGVLCEDPKARLFVLVIDDHGTEHARIFEPGEFRCPAS